MRPQHYLALGVRIFSIALFLYGLRQSASFVELITEGRDGLRVSVVFAISIVVVPILASIYLWTFPLLVAKFILKTEIDQPIQPIDARSMLTVLILAIALYFLYNAIIDSFYWATIWQMAQSNHVSDPSFYLESKQKANMVATGLELVASMSLLVKARSLAGHILRLTK